MLYILDRNEQVVGLLQSNSDRNKNIYYDDVLTEILSSGADTFTFTSIPDRETSEKLTVGNYIAFKKSNKFKLLQIIEVNESKDDVLTKEIYCEGAGLELINTVYSGSKMDSVNIKRFLINILQDTNWNVGYVDSNLTKTLSLDVEEKEVYSIIQEYLYDFEAEIDFRVEIKGNRIVGRYIDVYSKRGRNNGRRLEINRDIKSISRKVSLVNYATKLIGEGKNGLNFRDISMSGTIEKPLGQNFVVNEEAYSRINNKGKHITRKFTYDTEDAYELLRQTYKALKEYSEPKVTYEVDADILNFDDIEIGDYVSISDLSFTPPLLVTARISELETSKTNKYTNKAILSNFNEVRSGISSIFPILGEDIVSGSIGEDQMNPDYVDSIISDSVNASMVKTEILLADKANISDLNATNATVENLTADFAEIDELLAGNITAENIKADSITSDHIQANTIDTKHLKADSIESKHIQSNTIDTNHLKADIIDAEHINANSITSNHIQSNTIDARHINSNSINADHIQANTITSGHIQTGSITAGSGIIADGAIGNAQISQIDAGKIEAGTIDTSKVTIQGANGHLRLKGNRMQVFQGTGNQAKERVSVGDVNGDGSVYGLRVRGTDGQTILLDENGVKSEGITDGSITNDKISDDANIDGAKLNINSVVSKINEDGTETIQGTKIEVDGTTLNTKLSTITNKQTEDSERITQAQSQITANTNAIKLKVDEQTYTTDKKDMTSKLEKNTSEISTMKGQIALKVEQTDIENAKNEINNSVDTKIASAKSELKVTTDKISQTVSNLSQTVSTKADNSVVTSMSNKVGLLETSVNGISGTVSSLEKTTTTLGTQVSDAQSTANNAVNKANNAQSTANTNKNNITNLQGEVTTVKNNVASLEVTTSGISQKVSSVETTTATISDKLDNLSVGVRNYLPNTDFSDSENLPKWLTSAPSSNSFNVYGNFGANSDKDSFIKGDYALRNRYDIATAIANNKTYSRFNTSDIVLEKNTEYTISFYMYKSGNCGKCYMSVYPILENGSLGTKCGGTSSITEYTGAFEKHTVTFTTNAESNKFSVRFYNYHKDTLTTGYSDVHIYHPMLAKGNKAIDWTTAPEDTKDKLVSQETRISSAEQKITDKAITSVVQESQFIKDMDGKISTNKSNISKVEQTANSISSRVTALDGKYTEIKQTVDSIDLTGKVSFSDLSTSGKTTINGGNITTGTLDASKVNVTNLNASNIKSGKLSANYIDATNLSVKGELLSGQINGIGGMKFADGAVISSCESGVAGYKGIQISAPVIKLGDKVEIYRPTIFYDVTGKNNSSSNTTTWTMSSAGALTCTSASISGTTTVGSTLNVKNNAINGMNNLSMARGSVNIPIFGTNYTYDYIKGGASRIAFADSGPIHFLYNGSKSSFIAGGTISLPHAGNVNCDHFRLGAGIMASPSSGSFHFLTASGGTSPLYAGVLYSATALDAKEPMVISNNSVFDKINSINVIETKNGLRLHNPISMVDAIDESPEVVKTVYNEEKDEIKTSIDYTSAISTLWKAVQELKQENNELKEIIKSLCPKE